ncbi:histone, partial [Boletus edulis BED1]
ILWLDGNTFGMDSCKVGILEQRDKVSLSSLLQCHHSRRLEAQVKQTTHLEVLCNFTNETLERQLANEQLGRLLVSTNFTKSDRSWTESMRLLYTTSRLQT